MVRLKRFELLTHGLEGRCSIHLSYKRVTIDLPRRYYLLHLAKIGAGDGNRTHATSLEGWDSTIELHPHLQCLFILPKFFYLVKRFQRFALNFFVKVSLFSCDKKIIPQFYSILDVSYANKKTGCSPFSGAEKRIRTSGKRLTYTRFPIVLLKPLGHLCKCIVILHQTPPKINSFQAFFHIIFQT